MFGGCLLGLVMSDIQRCMIPVQGFDFLKQRGTRIISEVNKKFYLVTMLRDSMR